MALKNFDMLLAGVGGQGIILAGQIILESALKKGHQVYAFEEHGMARRGGAVASHIRFGEEIYTPLIPLGFGKLLAAFEPAEALRHLHFLDNESKIILNTKAVVPVSVSTQKGSYPEINDILDMLITRSREIYAINATALANEAGNPISMNIVMIGAICACGAVDLPREDVLEIIEKRSPSYSKDINIKAFELGYEIVEDAI
jgi:indolepyruvate ferredoxin oxidoreductase beta subunit